MKNLIIFLLLFSYYFGNSQNFTEISSSSLTGDGSGIYVNTTGYRTANDITVYPNVDLTLNQIVVNTVVSEGGIINSVTMTCYDDNNGAPGNIIFSQEDIIPTSQDIVYTSEWGNKVKKVVLDINPIVLNGQSDASTTYWISVVATVSNTGIVWWELTEASTTGSRIYEYLPSSGGWVRKGYGDGVYEFSGTMSPISGISFNPIFANPEDFETTDITTHGWSFYNTDGSDDGFVQTNSQANNGSFSFFHGSNDLSSEGTSYMVSPAISVNFFEYLSFWYRQHNTANFGSSQILISTESNNPITNPNDFIELVTLDETSIGGFSEDNWTKHIESLNQYSGQTIYIAFKYTGDASHELFIDDFSVEYDHLAYDETIGALHVNVLDEDVDPNLSDNFVSGSNVNATNSSAINETPTCGNFSGGDIWFKFEAPTTTAVQIVYPGWGWYMFSGIGHALYDSPLSTEPLICGKNGDDWNDFPPEEDVIVYFTNLTAGNTYYLRIWDDYNDNLGSVSFCLKDYTDPNIGVNNLQKHNFNIYPNPSKGIFNIDFSDINKGDITITNIAGKILYTKEISSSLKQKVDLSNFPKGVYFLKINSDKISKTSKLILK